MATVDGEPRCGHPLAEDLRAASRRPGRASTAPSMRVLLPLPTWMVCWPSAADDQVVAVAGRTLSLPLPSTINVVDPLPSRDVVVAVAGGHGVARRCRAWTLSLPLPRETVLLPLLSWMLSLPLPREMVLLLAPWMLSLPLPALMTSGMVKLLASWKLSLPAKPMI